MTAPVSTRPVPVELLGHLRRARDHIDLHFAEPVDLDRLARVSCVSRYYFARRFRDAYGETPIRYLTRRRIERAQDLLRHANLSVTEICTMVGFASLGSFSARFSELVGESPTAYRDRWAAAGRPYVPGCFIFMRGGVDPAGTSGRPTSTRRSGTGQVAQPGRSGQPGPRPTVEP